MRRLIARSWLVVAPWILAPACPAQDAPTAEASRSEVIDQGKMFPPEAVAKAKKRLEELEKASSVPVVIETVESLHGEPIEQAALNAARKTGGHGLFVFIAKDERKIAKPLVRRQFEHRVPDDRKAAIREAILKGFRAGDYGEGLTLGVEAIAATLNAPGWAAAEAPHAEAASTATPGAELIVRNRPRLTLAGARKVMAAGEVKAAEMGLKMNLAVVDDGGHLLTFTRMDGARPASVATAQTKAISAATFRQETGPLAHGAESLANLGLAIAGASGGARITALSGGVPIAVDGEVVGAIGVAGGSGEQDLEVARAAVAALAGETKPAPDATAK